MRALYLFFFIVLLLCMSACSHSSNVTSPSAPENVDVQYSQDWGNYILMFNPETGETDLIYERQSKIHFDIISYLNPPACGGSGCITASLVGWDATTSIATFQVTITNPSPWTPSDVRMIFYNLGGKDIVNRDSYTKAHVSSIEPFIAFGKTNPNRTAPAGGAMTEVIDIYWPASSSFFIFFKVTAWLWLNCQDPYEINSMYQNGLLTPSGGNAKIGCTILDWQNDVTGVYVDTTPITGSWTNLTLIGSDIWEATITNSMGVSPAVYTCLITASSPNPQNFDLYNYIDIEIVPSGWVIDGEWDLAPGPCTLDFGIIGNSPAGHALVAYADANNQCSEIWKYPGWGGSPALYAVLRNLDPSNPLFISYPVARLDAANDGAFGWTNTDATPWLNNPLITGGNTYCNFDNRPAFIWNPEFDDHRHYLVWMQELALTPVDCCDDFKGHQCSLYVNPALGLAGFHGIPGTNQGFDYTDADIIWEAIFPPSLVGVEPGQIDPADISGIDTMLSEQDGVILVYVALEVNRRIEVFMVADAGPGPVDIVNHVMTIWIFDENQLSGQPVDIELLPPNSNYEKIPNTPVICVLIDNANFPYPAPGYGGSVWMYNASTGVFVDRIGDSINPAVKYVPEFLDTDDFEWSIHIMQKGPVVTKYNYF